MRTLSRAFIAHCTTWNGSRQGTAFGALSATTVWIHSAPSALTCVSSAAWSGPSFGKNISKVSLLRPSCADAIRPAS